MMKMDITTMDMTKTIMIMEGMTMDNIMDRHHGGDNDNGDSMEVDSTTTMDLRHSNNNNRRRGNRTGDWTNSITIRTRSGGNERTDAESEMTEIEMTEMVGIRGIRGMAGTLTMMLKMRRKWGMIM